jgi:hypothetical protein
VGTNLKYGAHLEFGTQNMAPRPWLSTAFKLAIKNIDKIKRDVLSNFFRNFK